ncbi:MAG: lysine--tRNA ligase [Nanoarchaeota archaeon]
MAKDPQELVHWADSVVKRVVKEKGEKPKYTVAAGITPSGTIHVGNFREMITVDLVARAFEDAGKNVRFIYSWDDYDVFRKVPKNMPQQEMLTEHLRMPIVDIPDPYGTEKSYARHHEVAVESSIAKVGLKPEYLYQAEKYRNCEYADGIKKALDNTKKIKAILDEYRKEPLADSWLPVSGYCPECKHDNVGFSDYDGDHSIRMTCHDCHKIFDVDIRKAPFLKLPWRVDWPMRWAHEEVDFEPGGKEHSTVGGSYTTAKEIVKLYDWTAPTYQRYDFITIKGKGGKISSSTGNVITVDSCLEVYEPALLRWLFAGTRPNTEFAISFDLDVIKNYEDFDKCERIYFKQQAVKEKEYLKQKRIYELSCTGKPPKAMPYQPSFRHLTTVLLINSYDIDKTVDAYRSELKTKEDEARLRMRTQCAINWVQKHAPEEFRFEIHDSIPEDMDISEPMKNVVHEVADALKSKEWDAKELHNTFYEIARKHDEEPQDFFKTAYHILIRKPKGPRLANFILAIGKDSVAYLFSQV